jgi:hypothetical protein
MSTYIRSLLLVWCLSAPTAYAHHSFAAIYDSAQSITLEGSVAEFAFVNPHPFIYMTTKEGSRTKTWKLEMDNRFELADIGITAQTFKRGDRVVVTGHPGQTQTDILYVRRLIRPADGLRYEQVGSVPSIDFGSRR